MRRALAWAGRRTAGDLAALWVIEGIGSYGGQLAQAVETAGYTVMEAARMTKKSRNGVGKNDAIDAHRIASTVLSLTTDQLRQPRDNKGVQAALKTLLSARDVIGREQTRAINALTALLRTTDLGIDARRALSKRVITQVAQWRTRLPPPHELKPSGWPNESDKPIKTFETTMPRSRNCSNTLQQQASRKKPASDQSARRQCS
jgi:hypothetical protein